MTDRRQNGVWVELDERDLSCVRWAVPIVRGVEERLGDLAGVREGEAMSDILAAIVSRAERARLHLDTEHDALRREAGSDANG